MKIKTRILGVIVIAALAMTLAAIVFPVDSAENYVRRGRGDVIGKGSMVLLRVDATTETPAIVTRVVDRGPGSVNLWVLPDGIVILTPELRLGVRHGTAVGRWKLSGHL